MSLLECSSLVMHFGGVRAVDGVDFSMEQGTVHCLIGPNGAGKSTFFKMVTGLLTPTSGTVRFRAGDITGQRSSEIVRRGVGIKMQTPQLFDEFSVAENIRLGARRATPVDVADEIASRLISEFGLSPVASSPVGSLAHGIRQRVDIASVLAGGPDLILLDEPAAGMSDKEVEQIADQILIRKTRHTFLVVEHDMRFIRRIADVVTVLHQGKVFLQGQCDEVLADPGVRDIYLGRGIAAHA